MKAVSRKQRLRSWWLAVHLYLGLWLGIVLSVTGLTGSLLVFYIELDEWLNPQLQVTQPIDQPRLAYEEIFQALRRAEPQRQRGWRLEIPEQPQRMITARYYQPQETEHMGFAPLMVSINPYTGEQVRSRLWGTFAMTWLYDLHYTLLLDHPGKLVMAIVGGLLVVSLLSGVYLWWPPKQKWRSALTIKRHASVERLTYDLHKVSGIYSLILMLLLALTGIALEIPEYVNPLIDFVSPLTPPPKPKSTALEAGSRITLDQAVGMAQQLIPNGQLAWIETPHDVYGSYRINLYQDGEPSRRFPKTNVWIDQYSGQILAVQQPTEFSAGQTLVTWLHPLHSGEALAMPGRFLVCLSGLLCPMFFITGLLRWLQKRSAKKLKIIG